MRSRKQNRIGESESRDVACAKPHRRRTALVLAALVAAFARQSTGAGVVATDGSLGRATNLTGPAFSIPASLGKQVGPNLFHSFSRFSLDTGDVATFSAPSGAGISNVLARVTGGNASTIDGTLQCTIPGANFYLINPAGVVFTANAHVAVNGSFAVSTADFVGLADGGRFVVSTRPLDSTLTSAAPAAFGFINPAPAGVSVTGATLAAPAGGVFSVVSGPIQIVGGQIQASGGQVNLVAVASAGTVVMDPSKLNGTVNTQSVPTMAPVSVTQGSAITLDGDPGGALIVRAGDFILADSQITSVSAGANNGLSLDIGLTGGLQMSNSQILTISAASGAAGNITLAAGGTVAISGTPPDQTLGSFGSASVGGAGNGNVTIQCGSLALSTGARIQTDMLFTQTAAVPAGNIAITASGDVGLSGAAQIECTSNSSAGGGAVQIHGGSIHLVDSVISTTSLGPGAGGSITLSAPLIYMSTSAGNNFPTGIDTSSSSSSDQARAGDVLITGGQVQILSGANVNVSTANATAGGSIQLTATQQLIIDGQGRTDGTSTGLFADADSSGPGGNITVAAPHLELLGGGQISASAFDAGNAGTIAITVTGSTLINGNGTDPNLAQTGVFSQALGIPGGPAGRGGNITLATGDLQILNGGSISTVTTGDGNGGSIQITAATITLDSQNTSNITGISASTEPLGPGMPAGIGNGGDVVIQAGSLTILGAPTTISALTLGPGNGGAVNIIATGAVSIDGRSQTGGSGIVADESTVENTAATGNGGNIRLEAGSLSIAGGGQITAESFGTGPGGSVSVIAHQNLNLSGTSRIAANTFGPGNGGTVTVSTGTSLTLGDQSSIGASTNSTGTGGDVTVTAGSLVMTGQSAIEASGTSTATGAAGNVSIQAGTAAFTGGIISATSAGMGNAGNVMFIATGAVGLDQGATISAAAPQATGGSVALSAGSLTLAGASGISADALRAGQLTVVSPTISLTGGAAISTDTVDQTPGIFSNIAIMTANLSLDASRISSTTSGSGLGGTISIIPAVQHSATLSLANGSTVSAEASASGAAGSISITTGAVHLSDSTVTSSSTGIGSSGNVALNVAGRITLDRTSALTAQSQQSAGGNVAVTAGLFTLIGGTISTSTPAAGGNISIDARDIYLHSNATVSARAGSNGRISLDAPNGLVEVDYSLMTAQASGAGGGQIFIDPTFVILDHATLNGLSAHKPVLVRFDPAVILLRSESQILTRALSLPPDVDQVSQLVALPAGRTGVDVGLLPQCGDESATGFSSFIVTGRGGAAQTPGGWTPDLELRLPVDRR